MRDQRVRLVERSDNFRTNLDRINNKPVLRQHLKSYIYFLQDELERIESNNTAKDKYRKHDEEYIGKTFKDFYAPIKDFTNLYDLYVGAFFMENGWPEVYQVVCIKRHKVIAHNLTKDVSNIDFHCKTQLVVPRVIKLLPKALHK